MGELLVAAMIYGALGVVALLVWLFAFAIFGTAITAGVDKATRWLKASRQGPVTEAETDVDEGSIDDTATLRAMLRETRDDTVESEPSVAATQ